MLKQPHIASRKVGFRKLTVQLRLGNKLLKQNCFFLGSLHQVIIQQVIKPKPMRACHRFIYGKIALQAATSANSYNLKALFFGLYGTRIKINIGKGIQFIQHNINIIGANTRTYYGKPFVANAAGMGYKLPVGLLYGNFIKMFTHFRHPARVAHGNYGACKFIRP